MALRDEVGADLRRDLAGAVRVLLGEPDPFHRRMAVRDLAAEQSDAAAADDRDAEFLCLRSSRTCSPCLRSDGVPTDPGARRLSIGKPLYRCCHAKVRSVVVRPLRSRPLGGTMKIRMIIAAVAASCVLFQPAHAQDECASKVPLRPTAAVKTLPDKNAPKPAATTGAQPEVFQLKDPVYVQVTGLKEFLDENECRKAKNLAPRKLVLFLDGSSMKGLVGTLVEPPQANILRFNLDRTEENKAAWAPILVNPSTEPREKRLSVGIEDQYPFEVRYQDQVPLAAGVLFRSRPNLHHRVDDPVSLPRVPHQHLPRRFAESPCRR